MFCLRHRFGNKWRNKEKDIRPFLLQKKGKGQGLVLLSSMVSWIICGFADVQSEIGKEQRSICIPYYELIQKPQEIITFPK